MASTRTALLVQLLIVAAALRTVAVAGANPTPHHHSARPSLSSLPPSSFRGATVLGAPGFPPLYNLSMVGCNADNIHQIPGDGRADYFLARLPISIDKSTGNRLPAPGDFSCNFRSWGLVLLKMTDWTAFKLTFVSVVLWPNDGRDSPNSGNFPKTPIQGGKYTLDSAYDPTVIELPGTGELWAAFECAGQGFYTASCLGPLKVPAGAAHGIEGATVDLSRTVIVVAGTDHVAAALPKIFVDPASERLVLYFDYFILNNPGHIEARGVYLQQESGGARRFFAAGHADSIGPDDPSTVRVWSPGRTHGVPLSDAIADVNAVFPSSDGRFLFATADIGAVGCRAPTNTPQGCYRLDVARSNFALGEDTFNELSLSQTQQAQLPGNAMEYAKIMVPPDGPAKGQTLMYANFMDPRDNPGVSIPRGFHAFALPGDSAFWTPPSGLCGPSQPHPDWGNRANVCVKSCGALGAGIPGLKSFDTTCERNGMESLGPAWDTPHCCKPISCGDAAHPSPNWGTKGGLCLPSCGGIGGTASFTDACSNHDLVDVGAAYDVPYCCAETL